MAPQASPLQTKPASREINRDEKAYFDPSSIEIDKETANENGDGSPMKVYMKPPESIEQVEARLLEEVSQELEDARTAYGREHYQSLQNEAA